MEVQKIMTRVLLLLLFSWAMIVAADVDCTTVTGFLTACSTFITYGTPDPLPGSPCCDSMMSLGVIAESGNDRSICQCLMGLITTYNPNATAIATLPGFCGLSLGFILDPNTDCSSVP
ncbi:PREDICTED: putative non-specific lipid-transfer protein 14 [Populus euphratica]|uniref:Non-specific lipid-transfer protein 14 n=1 Tax=Populus euphratica TaxID=75702 RepID=A0AAJ6XTB0_POPEU|nr:PREDICTED: putative non-specific lipid-transfer protein 14 [Populus euphratica]